MLSRTPVTILIMLHDPRTLLATALLLLIPLLQPAFAREQIDGPHVRTGELPLRAAISIGVEQSMSFRRLVAGSGVPGLCTDERRSMTSLSAAFTFMCRRARRA
jgi:hypothetical protein